MTIRTAKCCECGTFRPTPDVVADPKTAPHFTDCGPGSKWSAHMCVVCGDHIAGHDSRVSTKDHRFKPGLVAEHDDFWCGCPMIDA